MTDEAEPMGPISYLIVEFPGNKMTGEGFPALIDLVDRGVIRILDLEFVTCRDDGSVEAIQLQELETQGHFDLTIFEGASSGILDQSDFDDARKALTAGLVGGHLDLREPMGDHLRGRAAPRRWRVGRRRATSRRTSSPPRSTQPKPPDPPGTDERGREHATTAQRCRPHGGDRRNGDRGLQPRLATPGQSLDATERGPGVRAAAAVRPAAAVRAAAAAVRPACSARAPAPAADPIDQLTKLAELKNQGILTDAEFQAQKAKILSA